jgi:hypothetical protein
VLTVPASELLQPTETIVAKRSAERLNELVMKVKYTGFLFLLPAARKQYPYQLAVSSWQSCVQQAAVGPISVISTQFVV